MHALDRLLIALAAVTTAMIIPTHWNPRSAFNWHPICNAVALGLLSLSAPLARSRSSFRSSSKRTGVLVLHAVLNCIAVALMLWAGLVAYGVKESRGKPHLSSTHAWFGAATGWYVSMPVVTTEPCEHASLESPPVQAYWRRCR